MIFGVTDGVVLYLRCCHVAYEFLVLKLVQREAITSFGVIVILLDIGDNTTPNLQHDIVGCRIFLVVLIQRFEVLAYDIAVRNHVTAEIE